MINYDWSGGVSSDNYIDHFWKELFENGPQLLPVPKKMFVRSLPGSFQKKRTIFIFWDCHRCRSGATLTPWKIRFTASSKKLQEKGICSSETNITRSKLKKFPYVPPFFSPKLSQIQPTQRFWGFSWRFCWYISPIKFSRERHHHQVQIAAHRLGVLQPSVALLPGSIGFAQLGFQTHSAVPG